MYRWVRIALKLGSSIRSSRPRAMLGCCATGISERPSMTKRGFAFATSTIVGARSALIDSLLTFTPRGIPGPRIWSGTRIDSS